jgi:hypothetical protein
MEFYSSIKKNEILSFVGKWMELENIILGEVSQIQNAKVYLFSIIHEIQVPYKYKQYYEKWVMLRGSHIQERKGKGRKLRRL